MPKIIIGYFMLILVLISCNNKEKSEQDETSIKEERFITIKSDKPIIALNAKAKELVTTWPEYQNFEDLITQYQEITVSEALLNSVELSVLAQQLKDSIRVEKLNIPEVKIRLNVLYSETLRLADMSSIPTITEESVKQENNNMINAFSALNLKINNMNLQDALNSEISKFVDEVLESPSIDSSDTIVKVDSID
ncbi:hypothetical protein QWY87_04560 [Lutimonas halocynthiae]|uniref:hypothetical protein n=1 Tax=Lutimonas halocynthiae TaxID=1446477 RepID=UPI0025B42F26|nr:hypothetical protein [Lutimonas halocynthiae]MDN3641959.1 hypothetical protein [Lutimonas halocynthiae]